MSRLANEEIEGRLHGQREILSFLVARLAKLEAAGDASEGLLEFLEERSQFQDHQEDPGAVPSGPALAIEAAMMREFRLVLEKARARMAEMPDKG